ncbi:hypothetical protein [Empedobacter tilapiae]|uniref:Lipoprotein n=1 Tax=Empedobacter tilapiae TaxID=2491114 RepID=A0A4Z1C2J8_9FLAO|nr:hypothetical protein [Empedobacter tilapiae]TGN29235.1 hypothetical protein E4J94_04585 [Empedobacter tilapiae]
MKKFFAVVAVAALSLGAVSCGEKKAEEAVENTVDSANAVIDSANTVVDSANAVVDSAKETVDSLKAEVPATETPAK